MPQLSIKNRNVVINSEGVPVVMGRNCEMVLLDEQGREKARHRVPYGAKLLADDGVQVTKGQTLAEWDPYTLPIITESDGIAHYVDLVEGVSMREVVDETTGISSRSSSTGSSSRAAAICSRASRCATTRARC